MTVFRRSAAHWQRRGWTFVKSGAVEWTQAVRHPAPAPPRREEDGAVVQTHIEGSVHLSH
jgi:hypothetical protein